MIYNVSVGVVELVRADSKEHAIARMALLLDEAGFTWDATVTPDVFESEMLANEDGVL